MQSIWGRPLTVVATSVARRPKFILTERPADMRVIVGAALYLAFAFLAGSYLQAYLSRRFSLSPLAAAILSQGVAIICAWVLLVLLFSL